MLSRALTTRVFAKSVNAQLSRHYAKPKSPKQAETKEKNEEKEVKDTKDSKVEKKLKVKETKSKVNELPKEDTLVVEKTMKVRSLH